MESVFIGATRVEATRMAEKWWERQKGLRQTLRTEMAAGAKGPDTAQAEKAVAVVQRRLLACQKKSPSHRK